MIFGLLDWLKSKGGNMSELEKLQNWVDEEKKKGLVGIHFSVTENVSGATVESFAKEVNDLINAKEVPITDLD